MWRQGDANLFSGFDNYFYLKRTLLWAYITLFIPSKILYVYSLQPPTLHIFVPYPWYFIWNKCLNIWDFLLLQDIEEKSSRSIKNKFLQILVPSIISFPIVIWNYENYFNLAASYDMLYDVLKESMPVWNDPHYEIPLLYYI